MCFSIILLAFFDCFDFQLLPSFLERFFSGKVYIIWCNIVKSLIIPFSVVLCNKPFDFSLKSLGSLPYVLISQTSGFFRKVF